MAYDEVVQLAYQIIDMHREVKRLRIENEELRQWEKKCEELQNECLELTKINNANMLNMLLTPGVSKAFLENANPEDFQKESQE